MVNLGLVSISFRNLTPEVIIEEVKKAGLSYIEWGSDVHAPYNDILKLQKIAKLQAEAGLFCSSYGTYFRLGENNTDELQLYINAAKILGTNILRLWCGNKSFNKYSEAEEAFLFSECKKAAAIAKKNNVTLCMECHNGTYTEAKEGAIRLMKFIDSPAFRMYWQPNQFVTTEENKKYARLIECFTKCIHVFNWDKENRYPLSEAIDLWCEYLSYFPENKTLLLEFMPDDSISSLKIEADSLKRLVK